MSQSISLSDALVLAIIGISENRIPHRAIYDMAYIANKPFDVIIAVDALVQLKEIVDVHYERYDPADFEPPYERLYQEAGDGDPFWSDEDREL